jgi:hypothetical protein
VIERLRRDPYVGFVIAVVALVAAALVAVGVAWEGLADSDIVSVQLAYAASGALGGVALLGFALGVASIQATRRAEARERAELDRVVEVAAGLLAAVRESSR